MPPKQESFTCMQCRASLSPDRFSGHQLRRKSRICVECQQASQTPAPILRCTRCLEPLERALFSPRQQPRLQRVCLNCTAPASARTTNRTCHICTLTLPRHCFAPRAVKCDGCVLHSRPDDPTSLITLGPCDRKCQFCGTMRFPSEAATLSCQAG